jgi:opacity protein-like surface antigen
MTQGPTTSLAIALLVSLSTLAAPIEAHAQQGFVAPLIGYDFGGDSGCPEIMGCEDKKLNVGIAFGTMGNVFGLEQEVAYADDFFGEAEGLSSSVLTVMTNFMIVPNLQVARPYFVVGIGLIKTDVEASVPGVVTSLISSNNNHFGWDIGGGLMIFFGRLFDDLEPLGISIEGRKLDYGRAAAAVVFAF